MGFRILADENVAEPTVSALIVIAVSLYRWANQNGSARRRTDVVPHPRVKTVTAITIRASNHDVETVVYVTGEWL